MKNGFIQRKSLLFYTNGYLRTTPSLATKYSTLTWEASPPALQPIRWASITGDGKLTKIISRPAINDLKNKPHNSNCYEKTIPHLDLLWFPGFVQPDRHNMDATQD